MDKGLFVVLLCTAVVHCTYQNVGYRLGHVTTFWSGAFFSDSSTLNNNLYLLTRTELYEYSPSTNETFLIASGLDLDSSAKWVQQQSVFDNCLYFASKNGTLYSYEPNAYDVEVVTTGCGGEWKGEVAEALGVVYFDGKNNEVCEYNPNTRSTRVLSHVVHVLSIHNLYSKIYMTTVNKLFELTPEAGYKQLLADGFKAIASSQSELYVYKDWLFKYSFKTGNLTRICTDIENMVIESYPTVGVYADNMLYIGAKTSVAISDTRTGSCYVFPNVIRDSEITSMTKLNNDVYIVTLAGVLYAVSNCTNLNNVLLDNYIEGAIHNTSNDESILRQLAYLNPGLNISALKITLKSKYSAIVKGNDEQTQYCGEKKIFYALYHSEKSIDFQELTLKGLLQVLKSKYRDFRSLISYDTNNVVFSNITAFLKSDVVKVVKNELECFKTVSFTVNPSNGIDTYIPIYLPTCEYSNVSITNAVSRILIGQENVPVLDEKDSWQEKLGVWPFVDENLITSHRGGNIGNNSVVSLGVDWEPAKRLDPLPIVLSQDVLIKHLSIAVDSAANVTVTATSNVELQEAILNLQQNIFGQIVGSYENDDHKQVLFSVSVKKVMKQLNVFLPPEMEINTDDSVSFNSELRRTLKRTHKPEVKYVILD